MQQVRLALMLILSLALNCAWIVEQPEGSKDVIMRRPRLDFFSNCISWAPWCWFSPSNFELEIIKVPYIANGADFGNATKTNKNFSCHEVWRNSFWMMHYGAASAKRTCVWSNCKALVHALVFAPDFPFQLWYMWARHPFGLCELQGLIYIYFSWVLRIKAFCLLPPES